MADTERWLVRTAQNQIKGPFSKADLCDQISDGQLSFQDEVCPANGYWFYLHERQLVQSQLGVEVPKEPRKPEDEEITQVKELTLTLTPDPHEEPTDPDLGRVWDMAQRKSRSAPVASQAEPIISTSAGKSIPAGSTAILSETALKEIRSHRKSPAPSATVGQESPEVSARGHASQPNLKKKLGFFALALLLIVLAWYFLSFLKS